MKKTGKCPKCGGTEVIANAKPIDRVDGQPMSLVTFRNPTAFVFKQQQDTTVSAYVCSSCGYVEFYADYPEQIQLPVD